MQYNFNTLKLGFLGAGNLAQIMMASLLDAKLVKAAQLVASNRTPGKLQKLESLYGISIMPTNEELIDASDVVIVAVKPQDLFDAVEPLASQFSPDQIVVSLAAGVPLNSLQKILPTVSNLVRVMPNTPSQIHRGVIGYCLSPEADDIASLIERLLEPLGYVVAVEEGMQFDALTVAAASGTGFVYEFMTYWREWLEEHDFDSDTAARITLETFLGAALLAESSAPLSVEELQDKVVSKKGVTFEGLESMRELDLERVLRYSFEKAVLRSQKLGQSIAQRRKTQY